MGNIFENNKYRIIYYRSEKVVEFYMKNLEIGKEDIIEMHKITLILTEGEQYASIFSAEDFFSITTEARTEGSKPYYSQNLIAQALVVKNLAQRLIGNFIMRINKPVRDTKMFAGKAEAKVWVLAKIKEHEAAKKHEEEAVCV